MFASSMGMSHMDILAWLLLGGAGIMLLLGGAFIALSDHRQRMKRLNHNRHA